LRTGLPHRCEVKRVVKIKNLLTIVVVRDFIQERRGDVSKKFDIKLGRNMVVSL
jgi:hypothetical protein